MVKGHHSYKCGKGSSLIQTSMNMEVITGITVMNMVKDHYEHGKGSLQSQTVCVVKGHHIYVPGKGLSCC